MLIFLSLLIFATASAPALTTQELAEDEFYILAEFLSGDDFEGATLASSSMRIDAVAAIDKSRCKPQSGLASWYGGGDNGSATASGERFNMYAMTAANRVLPMGTRVRVTNMRNGRSVVVRINDRGPYVNHGPKRVIDLSQAAASKLDILDHGLGPVEVDCL